MRKIIITVSLCVMSLSLFMLTRQLYSYYEGQKVYQNSQRLISEKLAENADGDDKKQHISVDFNKLKQANPEVKAWIFAENTPINYPVVQGKDNQKYLTQMYNLEWNGCGAIFIDFRCENPFKDFNTIIYGHRMKDNSMFGSFGEYRKQQYFDSHNTIELITPEKYYEVKLFAVATVADDSQMYKLSFDNRESKQEYLKMIEDLNEVESEVRVTPGESIVMFSTCTYEYEGARLIIYGKIVEE